jgi:fibronectin type III domain protein
LNTKLAGLFVLIACVLTGCGQGSSSAPTATASAASTSPPPPSSPPPSPPSPTSGNATLSWQAPTTDTNGAPLTDLSGYRIYYGTDASNLSDTVQLTSVGIQTYVIDNLAPGTWYFAIKAETSTGVESALSSIVSKTI